MTLYGKCHNCGKTCEELADAIDPREKCCFCMGIPSIGTCDLCKARHEAAKAAEQRQGED